MLDSINIEEILFLDIETVPQSSAFDQLDEEFRKLWEEKSAYIRERKELTTEKSYESAGIYAEFGKVVCIGLGYFAQQKGERVFRVTSFSGHDERKILSDFSNLLNSRTRNPFNYLCAHNGKEFDYPYLCRRLLINGLPLPAMLNIAGKKPWEVSHLDTLDLWKFGDFKHYTSLKLLAKIFGIPTPKDDIDGSQVRSVYYEEKNLERIDRYCRKDVFTLAQVFLRYKGEQLIEEENVIEV